MRSIAGKLSTVLVLAGLTVGLVAFGGCSELETLKTQNRVQAERISSLQADLEAARLELDGCKKRLATLEQSGGVEAEALRQKIAALEKTLGDREELIKKMQAQLLGGGPLPVELNTALEDFARQNPDLIEYDPNQGVVKFKSDLLFEKGSDQVGSSGQQAIRSLAGILNTEQARQFDIIVAGFTDDIPIRREQTRAAHPTNWDLSADRALAVLKLMETDGIASTRLRECGFGENRPVAPNAPNKGGNPKNRRVEIYVVPKGV
jgi:flagellar motor protein MotB